MAILQGKLFFPECERRLESYDVVYFHDGEKIDKRRADIEVILIYGTPGGEQLTKLMDELPNLKAIVNHGVGVNHIDLEAAKARGIKVSNTPDCLNAAVAEMAFALLLAAARHVVTGNARSHDPTYTRLQPNWHGTEVSGSAIGIVGMGRIGMEIAQRARAFNMKIFYHNRKRRSVEEEATVKATYCEELNALLGQVDFVVVMVPGGEATRKLFKWEQFCAMKETAYFVNVSRGTVVDQDALVRALNEKRIAGKGARRFLICVIDTLSRRCCSRCDGSRAFAS